MLSRRNFLKHTGATGALGLLPAASFAVNNSNDDTKIAAAPGWQQSLDGVWQFSTDKQHWQAVTVPHTWQIMPEHVEHFGKAWYKRECFIPAGWKGRVVRAEFEAVYHSARVYVNGVLAGEHLRKGYTAFFIDLTPHLQYDRNNTLEVEVDNAFDDNMLPRNRSYDWAADGGITRPVTLHVTPVTYLENIWVAALPDAGFQQARLKIKARLANKGKAGTCHLRYEVTEEDTGRQALAGSFATPLQLTAGEVRTVEPEALLLPDPRLWHFDAPRLYRLTLHLYQDGDLLHSYCSTFGVRSIAVKDTGFYLNGERVWLMGVERMGGSNPLYGMAEPGEWIRHDHDDMKKLNCIFTRVHWQQDKRVLDYCDRHGILIQLEVPTWGGATFEGMKDQPSAPIMQNGLEQLEELIEREYNHPCVFSWGLCNEIGGQNPPAYNFAANMLKAAKKLDPYRLCSYASNSLQQTPGKDVSGLMDFVEWNEYYGSWYKGTVEDMERNLEAIHQAFPDKPIVISEYGWCRCKPERKEGDTRLISILRSNNEVFRRHDYVSGLIFFSYNDYRTHIGDKGIGVLKQRVHGVVDLYGAPRPSWEVLRAESSPLSTLSAGLEGQQLAVKLATRKTIPAYTLRKYILRWIAYGDQEVPLETGEIVLPDLAPGQAFEHTFRLTEGLPLERIVVDVVRGTGFSALSVQIPAS
ncbi:glycoside hydrolase family 2 TIM barrel-domain containing protein [Chitinophaga japonensis]|uniref:Beta-glucuronidase n=1 Tax=Chitinophaga japonensis TaxID=104662 RepID=A0A562T446_CHIJA|nr:glycoside hydrolase family 2 TIM barrel-domain containing protein [Chitinophaga japonensis]TWI88309.1 beta-glucuronidase [Chitinophaga japonensis]